MISIQDAIDKIKIAFRISIKRKIQHCYFLTIYKFQKSFDSFGDHIVLHRIYALEDINNFCNDFNRN